MTDDDLAAIRLRHADGPATEDVHALCDEITDLHRKLSNLTLHSLGCPAIEGGECEYPGSGPCLNRTLWDRVHAAEGESLADRMRRAGWTDRQIGAAMDAAGAAAPWPKLTPRNVSECPWCLRGWRCGCHRALCPWRAGGDRFA